MAKYAGRGDLDEAHDAAWAGLGRAGTWLTGAERIAVAREARRARAERGLALMPEEPPGEGLDAGTCEVARRVGGAPGTIDRAWFDSLVPKEIDDARYVESVGVVARSVSIDVFDRGVGAPQRVYPDPSPGEPRRTRPASAVIEEAWVASIPNGEAGGDEGKTLYGAVPMPNVCRALSLVPDEAQSANRLGDLRYVEIPKMGDPAYDPGRGISRSQIELVAGRVSAINECFY